MPACKNPEAEAVRRAKISATTRGVPKGHRETMTVAAREKQSATLRLVWANRSAESRTEIGSKISQRAMQDAIVPDPDKKRCRSCRQVLPLGDYPEDTRNKDGLFGSCRKCVSIRASKWQAEHPDRVLNYRRAHYNVDFNDLWSKQDGKCALCGDTMLPRGKGPKSVVIDHDHNCCPPRPGRAGASCGKCVRGLLHRDCNLLLGRLEKNPGYLQRAEDYLRRWREKTP